MHTEARASSSFMHVKLLAGLLLGSCAQAPIAAEPLPVSESAAYASWPDPLADMPRGAEQTARVCARPAQDVVRDALCAGQPLPSSLVELQTRLGVSSEQIVNIDEVKSGELRALSISAHSTALSKRSVSAINPRLVAVHLTFKPPARNDKKRTSATLFALAFTRGEQFVELVASDRSEDRLNFYVVGFRQACNDSPEGCSPGDLLTGAIESDWRDVTLYDESDLTNTVLDCATCHQSGGPGTAKLLRMQELDSPWTHWFSPETEGGRALLDDYLAAHGDEIYAGMPGAQIAQSDPNALATMVFLANPVQPNEFDSLLIETEIKQSAAALGGAQPADNSVPGMSATWRRAFEAAARGDAISVPYSNVKVTDPGKLASMTAAYQAYRAGRLTAAELPDIRDVFPDSQERLAEIGVSSQPGEDGASVLMSACAQCHNARLDQTLTRARFRADLQGMTRAQKDLAIARLQLPPEHPQAMPPARLRMLTSEARERALARLRE